MCVGLLVTNVHSKGLAARAVRLVDREVLVATRVCREGRIAESISSLPWETSVLRLGKTGTLEI